MIALYPILEIVVAFLAALGLLALGWLLFGRLLTPVGGKKSGRIYAVIPASGDGETLEDEVRGLAWLRGGELARFPILVADCGLSDRGRAVAAVLSGRETDLTVCPAERLGDYIKAD